MTAASPVEFVAPPPLPRQAARWWWPRSWGGLLVHAAFVPVALGSVLAVLEALGRSQLWWGWIAEIFALVLGAGVAALGFVLAPFSLRNAARLFVWGCVWFLANFTALTIVIVVRMNAFDRCGQRAQPLVDAIARFTKERDAMPGTLADLVPDYLPAVPGTGMPAYPEFVYRAGGEIDARAGGFELRIPCREMIFSGDVFVYWPSGDYPDELYSGSVQRSGAWAYVTVIYD